jgi:hypothetical protein
MRDHLDPSAPRNWAFFGGNMCGWQIRNQGGGAEFGGADTIVGYECEGCQIEWREGAPYATGKNGAAANFEILAPLPQAGR